jgi:transcriptional regulator with XRE-family HTH domain
MNKLDELIRDFRSDPEQDKLFRESEAELALADRMTEMRLDAGLTQAELAERLGKTQAYVAKMEAGGYDRCGIGTLQTFARALGHQLDAAAMFVSSSAHSRFDHRVVLRGAAGSSTLQKVAVLEEYRRATGRAAVG